MKNTMNRRDWMLATSGSLPLALAPATAVSAPRHFADPWKVRYCLNTSTVRGQKLDLVQQVELAAKAGYDGIEPWIRDIDTYVKAGGSLPDVAKRIQDAGLKVESAIGFASWIVDDEMQRTKGLEQARHDMEVVRAIGGTRIAAPPSGATRDAGLDLSAAAQRYRVLAELGASMQVVPQLELWGFSKNLYRLGELVYVATEAAHENTAVLPDVYHIYKGGSDFDGLRMINGRMIHCFHMNDYPDNPPRATIKDADRVYPGDGVAPLSKILNILRDSGFAGALSLELFNPDYWKQDALHVARTGLEKMKQAVARA